MLLGLCFVPQDAHAAKPVYTVDLLAPAAGNALRADTISEITWKTGEGDASRVNLLYSVDNGFTWEVIEKHLINDGSYHWTVAHVQSQEVVVKIVTTDLVEEFASDITDAFSIWIYAEDNSPYWEEGITGVEEVFSEIDGITEGDFVKIEGTENLFYIDEGMVRRPLFDEQTYFTYEDRFDAIVEISQNTSNKFDLGAPLAPQAGAALIKTPSSNRVYWAEGTGVFPTLHWITREDIAEEMFGSEWNSHVFNVDSTLFTRYDIGEEITEAFLIDRFLLK